MSLWNKIEDAFTAGWEALKDWIAPEVDAAEELLKELGSEVMRIGPQLIYDAAAAALATVASSGLPTGKLISQAADVAIDKLKTEGKTEITAAVFGAVSAALLKLHASAEAAGIKVASADSSQAAQDVAVS